MTISHPLHLRPAGPSGTPDWLGHAARRVWAILSLADKRLSQMDGTRWAGTFAFNAFFSLLPLIILLVTIASFFVERERAGNEVIAYLGSHVPWLVVFLGLSLFYRLAPRRPTRYAEVWVAALCATVFGRARVCWSSI
jgi:Ca2+-transporting ATPase